MRDDVGLLAIVIGFLELVKVELESLTVFALILLFFDLHFVEEGHRHVGRAHGPEHARASVRCTFEHFLAYLVEHVILLFFLFLLIFFLFLVFCFLHFLHLLYLLYTLHHILISPDVLDVLLYLVSFFLPGDFAVALHALGVSQCF